MHTKFEIIIRSARLVASVKGFKVDPAGAAALRGPLVLPTAFGLLPGLLILLVLPGFFGPDEGFRTVLPGILRRPTRGLAEMISSRDLSRLSEDIFYSCRRCSVKVSARICIYVSTQVLLFKKFRFLSSQLFLWLVGKNGNNTRSIRENFLCYPDDSNAWHTTSIQGNKIGLEGARAPMAGEQGIRLIMCIVEHNNSEQWKGRGRDGKAEPVEETFPSFGVRRISSK